MENLKDHITKNILQLKEEYYNGLQGLDLARRYSSIIDGCIEKIVLSDVSLEGAQKKNTFAVAALGGYGRQELGPYSDIDIMFLVPERRNGQLKDLAAKILYPLWDAGLVVGHSNRTLKDCSALLKDDITVRTSLLEMRYLSGSRDLYSHFQDSIHSNAFSQKVNTFVSQQLEDIQSRHQCYGDSVYLLEPHLKEGEGGLRDIQSALWIAKVKFQALDIDALKDKGVLSPWEVTLLEESLEFLWKVRNGIHFMSGRKNDHLAFEYQEKIGNLLGYDDSPSGVSTKRFMHEYYKYAENIRYLSSVLIERSKEHKKRKRITRKAFYRKMDKGFKVENNKISVVEPDLFQKDPSALMRVFTYSLELGKEISADTQELIRNSAEMIDDTFRNAREVNRDFLSILKGKKGVTKVLKTMHRLGILGAFIPEFSRITHLPQSHHYHLYTADIHTLYAIEELEKLLSGHYKAAFPFLGKLVSEETKHHLIFLALLFHDLGKASEADHVKKGVEIVGRVAKRMGLPAKETEYVRFLVENHIDMARIAQTRDLSDEGMIIEFAQKMKDLDRLRGLYFLTFADLKASRAEAFNSWKNSLFRELYTKTAHILEKGDFTMKSITSKLEKLKSEVAADLHSKMPLEDIQYNLELMPARYMVNNNPEVLSDHILLCYNLEDKALAFDVRKKRDNGYYDVLIATSDFHGLFSKVCGVMVSHNMNILDAQIDTRSDGIAIELLRVQSLYADEALPHEEWKAIREDLQKVIEGRIQVEDLVKKKESYLFPEKKGKRDKGPAISIDNDTSDFYTVIDVQAQDRFGLLYSITKTMWELGVNIYVAKIATALTRVTDSFYVRDMFGQKIYDEKALSKIKENLLKILR